MIKAEGFYQERKGKMMKNVNNDPSELFKLLLRRASVCNLGVGKTSFKSSRKITFYAKRDFCLLSKVKLSIAKTPY